MRLLNPMTRVLVRDQKDERHTRGRDMKTEVKVGSLQPQSRRTEVIGVRQKRPWSPGEMNESVNEPVMFFLALSLFPCRY